MLSYEHVLTALPVTDASSVKLQKCDALDHFRAQDAPAVEKPASLPTTGLKYPCLGSRPANTQLLHHISWANQRENGRYLLEIERRAALATATSPECMVEPDEAAQAHPSPPPTASSLDNCQNEFSNDPVRHLSTNNEANVPTDTTYNAPRGASSSERSSRNSNDDEHQDSILNSNPLVKDTIYIRDPAGRYSMRVSLASSAQSCVFADLSYRIHGPHLHMVIYPSCYLTYRRIFASKPPNTT